MASDARHDSQDIGSRLIFPNDMCDEHVGKRVRVEENEPVCPIDQSNYLPFFSR